MSSFEQLQDIYKQALGWERELKGLYEVAEYGLRNPEAKVVVRQLYEEHEAKRKVLEGVDLTRFGSAEWVKFPPALPDGVVPKKAMTRDSSAEEVLRMILAFQLQLEHFYRAMQQIVTGRELKELFESLSVFKHNQAEGIRRQLH